MFDGRKQRVKVYKFLSEQWAIDNLVKKRIKASTLEDMNDPFECNCIRFPNKYSRKNGNEIFKGTLESLVFSVSAKVGITR